MAYRASQTQLNAVLKSLKRLRQMAMTYCLISSSTS